MGIIIAMGGGEMRVGETLPLDQQVVFHTGKSSPKALFIPTASSDAVDYYGTFRAMYSEKLGCETDVLYLIRENPTFAEIESKIAWADLVYVGGGNTLKMMRRWRKLGVDGLLKNAHQNGTVMAGLSAGAICWFAYGHSDSRSFSGKSDWQHIRVRGLGLVNALYCPHLDSENRTLPMHEMMKKYPQQVGIACEDHCAIEIVNNTYRIIGAGNAYRFEVQQGKVVQTLIEKSDDYTGIAALISRR